MRVLSIAVTLFLEAGFVASERQRPAKENSMLASPNVYSPEELNFLHQVLDEAVRTLPVPLQTSVSKSRIAKRILDCAATGERNRVELRMAGLADFNDNGRSAA
jgi:hypothetical protein